MEITKLSAYQRAQAIKECAKKDQINNVKQLHALGVSRNAVINAYAQACLNRATESENFLANLIKGE